VHYLGCIAHHTPLECDYEAEPRNASSVPGRAHQPRPRDSWRHDGLRENHVIVETHDVFRVVCRVSMSPSWTLNNRSLASFLACVVKSDGSTPCIKTIIISLPNAAYGGSGTAPLEGNTGNPPHLQLRLNRLDRPGSSLGSTRTLYPISLAICEQAASRSRLPSTQLPVTGSPH
jgi:hypothetical protein